MRFQLFLNIVLSSFLVCLQLEAMSGPKLPESAWHKKISYYNQKGVLLNEEILIASAKPSFQVGYCYCQNPEASSSTIIYVDKIWYMSPVSLDEYLHSGGSINDAQMRGMVGESMRRYNYDTVKLLVSRGANPNPRLTSSPGSAYLLAFHRGHSDMAKFIKEKSKQYEINKQKRENEEGDELLSKALNTSISHSPPPPAVKKRRNSL